MISAHYNITRIYRLIDSLSRYEIVLRFRAWLASKREASAIVVAQLQAIIGLDRTAILAPVFLVWMRILNLVRSTESDDPG